MTNDQNAFSRVPPNWTQAGAAPHPAASPLGKPVSAIERFLGGSPTAVFMKLVFVSLLAGALMMWLNLRPADLLRGVTSLIDRLWSLGFDAVREMGEYILAGAMIVVPVWLISRFLSLRRV